MANTTTSKTTRKLTTKQARVLLSIVMGLRTRKQLHTSLGETYLNGTLNSLKKRGLVRVEAHRWYPTKAAIVAAGVAVQAFDTVLVASCAVVADNPSA